METQDNYVGKIIGTYEIARELGRGGMGMVYKAHETSLNRVVALKILPGYLASDDAFLSRFVREARAAASLVHPNVVTIYAVGEAEGIHFIAMEYVKGQTITQLIRQSGSIHPNRALEIILESASALAEAHKRRIIHRDIKPQNIMVDETGRVRVMDFGLAKATTSDSNLTADGALLGTPMYMSPEQCEGKPADRRSDIYALGVVFYEMLTGHAPFEAPTPLAVMRQIVDAPFPNVRTIAPTVPENVARILDRMVAKDIADRYQTVEDIRRDVSEALGVASSSSTPTGGTTRISGEETEILPSSGTDHTPVYSSSGVTQQVGGGSGGLFIALGLFAGLVLIAGAIFAAGGGLERFFGGVTEIEDTPAPRSTTFTPPETDDEQATNDSEDAAAAAQQAALDEQRQQTAAERAAAAAARVAAEEEAAQMQAQLDELERRRQEAMEAERRAVEARDAEEAARLAAAAEAERARQLEAELAEIERQKTAAEEAARRAEAERAAALQRQREQDAAANQQALLDEQRRQAEAERAERERIEAELARIRAEQEAVEIARRAAEEEAAEQARLEAEQRAAAEAATAEAAAKSPPLAGVWSVDGKRPTAEGNARMMTGNSATITADGTGATIQIDGKTLHGTYNNGILKATYATEISARGRSGVGRTRVDQVWEIDVTAVGPNRLEGRYEVTHRGFSTSEGHKNGTQSESLVLYR